MNDDKNAAYATHASLLIRVKDVDDHQSWSDFYQRYNKLIYSVAIKAGLADAEAQDVVQETLIAAAEKMPGFHYDPAKGSFRSWLLQITRRRIIDQFRKRQKVESLHAPSPHESQRAPILDHIANPATTDLQAIWDAEWEQHVFKKALEAVSRELNAKHYEIFKQYVLEKQPVANVVENLGVTESQVYVVKNRVSELMRKEIKSLEQRNET